MILSIAVYLMYIFEWVELVEYGYFSQGSNASTYL